MHKPGIIALLLAISAALLTYYYLSEKESSVRTAVTPVKVLMAKKAIARGARLTADKVKIQDMPGAYVMPGALVSTQATELVKQWVNYQGQFALVPIAEGEQILPNKLSRILPGFAGVVPEGQRIMALELDMAAAVGGHINPGNHVDVLGTFDYQFRDHKQTTTVILAQNILITAVGEKTVVESSPEKKANSWTENRTLTVCLSLSPEDAVRLALAEKEGRLKLALRSIGDEHWLDLSDQNLGTLLGPLLKARREEIKPAQKAVPIFRGIQ